MSGGVLRRLWPARLAIAAGLIWGVGQGKAEPAWRALPTTMPASYYGMEEAERNDGLMREVVLGMHNAEREALGLAPLAWDSALAADAASYAREMARTDIFRHSPRASRAIPSGENLWMGSRGHHDYQVMVDAFLDERRLFRRTGKLPDISTSGRWEDVGHYTQIIWRGTRKVGCALAEGQSYDYLVCRYFPAGNVFGRNPLDRDEAAPPRYASGG
ncbi:CAP domain-containing protein [Sphingobium bisphenolivorans]|uniref:CAP domain-containing protein n=1 Tax=Sphingobium bisphenolivorans TaxID=1335760 RepID=UPI00187C941C|nr:CAP domain-containing protein [Sphingobium bisphenolivorans]